VTQGGGERREVGGGEGNGGRVAGVGKEGLSVLQWRRNSS